MSHGPSRGAGHPLEDWRGEHLPINRDRTITAEEKAERERLCLEAVEGVTRREVERFRELGLRWYYWKGVTAATVAAYIGVAPAQQLGSGAKKGSWSGSMIPALRVAPMLRSLQKRGLIEGQFRTQDDEYRWYYWPEGCAPWELADVIRGDKPAPWEQT